jgi:UDP-N-acetylmuramoylalanine--D-glutamate ligase
MRLVVLGGGESGRYCHFVRKRIRRFVSDFGKIKQLQGSSYNNGIDWEEERHTEDLI